MEHLGGENVKAFPTKLNETPLPGHDDRVLSGSLLGIASSLVHAEAARVRKGHEPRRRGTIAAPVFRDRKKRITVFVEFMDERRGLGAAARMRLTDLAMEDVEASNLALVRTREILKSCGN